jgi:hypothetical protein
MSTIDQFWILADLVVNATSNAERRQALSGFTGNPVLLQQFCRAIKTNGSRSACPEWLVKSLESEICG